MEGVEMKDTITNEKRKKYMREYMKKWYNKNRDKYKIYRETKERKEYMKIYAKKHKESIQEYKRKWHIKNRDKIIKKVNKWEKDNPERYAQLNRKKAKRYQKKYPERVKASNYVYNNKQRDDTCSQCSSTENLEFHHTDYENNKGTTLCRNCHKQLHRGEVFAV